MKELLFMIQPLFVKGNGFWTLISIIHNVERPGVSYCMKTTAFPEPDRLLFVYDEASSLLSSEISLLHQNHFS